MNLFDVERFLKLIESTPAIWDVGSEIYTQRILREKGWVNIAQKMIKPWKRLDQNEQEEQLNNLKNKWRHIRDNYIKHQTKSQKTVGNRLKHKYIYSCYLKFLDRVTIKRRYETRKKNVLPRRMSYQTRSLIAGPEEVQVDHPSTSTDNERDQTYANEDPPLKDTDADMTPGDSEQSVDYTLIQPNLEINFKTEIDDPNDEEDEENVYGQDKDILPGLDYSEFDCESQLHESDFVPEEQIPTIIRHKRKPTTALDKAVNTLIDIAQKYTPTEQNEFEVFGRHVAKQLSSLPLDEALQLQEEIQRMMTWTRLRCLRNLGEDL